MAQTITGENSQQCLMIQGMFGLPKQANVITVGVTSSYGDVQVNLNLEVIPSGDFVCYRVVTKGGAGLWSSWGSVEAVAKWFKAVGLLCKGAGR